MKFLRKNWGYILAGLGIAVLYFIRLYHLTLLPIFADEAIYVRWSQIMATEPTLRFLPLSDGKEPLYMWVLMFVIRRITDPLFVGRLVSVLSGLGTLIGVWYLGLLLFRDKKVALLAGLIYALSPFTFFFDRMALVDSMLTMFGVWTFVLSYLAFTKRRLDLAMIAGFALGGAWLTKSTALLFMVMLPALWLFAGWKKWWKTLFLTLVIVVIAYGMYNILRLGPNFNLIASRNQDYVYPLNHVFVSPLDPLKGHLGGIVNFFYLMAPVGLVALWLLGYFVKFKKEWRRPLALSIWGLAPIIVTAEYFKVVTARYIVYTLPFFMVLAASSFLLRAKALKVAFYLSLLVFLAQSAVFDFRLMTNVDAAPLPAGERTGYLTEWTAGQGIKEISEYLKAQVPALGTDQKIVVGTEGYFGTLPDGLQMYMQGVDRVVVIGVGLGFDKVPGSLAASRASGNKTYLVINKSRLYLNPEKSGFELIASYKKPLRDPKSLEYKKFGPQDELLFFELK